MQTEIIVINELPEDIFSTYLLGGGFKIKRLNLREILQDDFTLNGSSELILAVNHSNRDGSMIKNCFSEKMVLLVSGGKKDFAPFITVINEHYCDYAPFSNWEEFISLLNVENLKKKLKENNLLVHYSGPYWKIVKEFFFKPVKKDFSDFIKVMVFLSKNYLNWLSEWESEVLDSKIPISIDAGNGKNKKVKAAIVVIKNNHKGLPILKEGDQVFLGSLKIEAIATLTTDNEVTFCFAEPISRDKLLKANFLTLKSKSSSIIEKRDVLYLFETLLEKTTASNPAEFLASGERVGHCKINQPLMLFNKDTDKVRRDVSQVEALIKIMSSEFFTLVVGPAATGKTFVTAAANYQFYSSERKNVLVVSHSNLGVDNLIIETAKHVDSNYVFRLGNDIDVISPAAQKLHCDLKYKYFGSTKQTEKSNIKKLNGSKGLVFGCTMDSFRWVSKYFKELGVEIDVVMIDEASRGFFVELLPVIMTAKSKVVLIGDNKQLGNIPLPKELLDFLEQKISDHQDFSKIIQAKSLVYYFERGFFNSLIELGFFQANLLTTNRRSLENINKLVSNVFYDGKLKAGRFNPQNKGKLSFIETLTPEERKGTSFVNHGEANIIVAKFIQVAVSQLKSGGKITDLVIISPYMAQVRLLKQKLRKHLLFNETLKAQVNTSNLEEVLEQIVITVDAIQGGQRKIVFVSLVRSNNLGQIGFNHDIRRLNVALSRAQEFLIIVGNPSPFLDCQYNDIKLAFKQILEIIRR